MMCEMLNKQIISHNFCLSSLETNERMITMSFSPLNDSFKSVNSLLPALKRKLLEERRNSTLRSLNEMGHLMRAHGASPASIKKALEGYYEYCKLLHQVPVTQEELKKITEEVIPSASIPKLEVPGQLLSEVEARQINWLWPGRIPLGKITILDGDPGMGKSLITVDLAARLSTGQPMPDGTLGQQGTVLLVAPEDDPYDTLKPRLEAAGGDPARVRLLHTGESFDGNKMRIYDRPFSLPRDFDALIKTIKSTGAILVILDPLTAIIGNNVNISHDQAIREIFTPLALLAERTSCAILIVRHLGKGSSSNPLHRGAGSIGIIAAARTGLIIAPHPENHHQRILATTKNNLSKHASDLIYQVVENTQGQPHIHWLGESQFAPSAVFNTGSPMSIARQNILRVLRESDSSLGPLKIADRTGLDYAKVRKLLSSMSSERKIISRAVASIPLLNILAS
jgi:hypothetical protein